MDSESISHNFETVCPSVDSSDPNERKLARRLRIQARLEVAEKEKALAEGKNQKEEPEPTLIQEAIETSDDTICQLYLDGKELVTNVVIASDAKEVARREELEEERNARLEKLKEESALALERLNEISSKWETIMNINEPLELFDHMKEQKAKCLELIEQKNQMIKDFQKELKLADEKFMKGRRAMYEELALLTKRIDEQVLLMRKAYRLELGHIEESVDKTRAELIEQYQKTWQSLFNLREKNEITNMSRKFELVENFHEELHSIHVEHEEKYRATRIHLETDVQVLEQELEKLKALCLLNSEKLDYNYQVLKKREEENVYIKNHQKRRLNKLQDMVNTLKKKIEDKRLNTDEECKKLSREVGRYYKNLIETEQKAERFSQLNDDKFLSIWDMKDEEARELLDKILDVDMVIHEQILGLEWTSPPNRYFTKVDMPIYKTAMSVVQEINGRKKRKVSKASTKSSTSKLLEVDEPNADTIAGYKRLLSHIFERIADQSGFLMEEKLDELLRPYTQDEKTLVRLDNVFAAIDIRTKDDIEIMMKIFLPYTVCLICDKRSSTTSVTDQDEQPKGTDGASRHYSILQIGELEQKVSKLRVQAKAEVKDIEEVSQPSIAIEEIRSKPGSEKNSEVSKEYSEGRGERKITPEKLLSEEDRTKCDITHPLMIEKFCVLRALKDFVSYYHADRITQTAKIEDKLIQKRITVSRLLGETEVIAYWDKYREAIPSNLENKWNGVYAALNKYLDILKERHNLNVKAQALRRQNLDLKRLLSKYKVDERSIETKLPVILRVPNEPIDFHQIANISQKLFY